ITKYHKGGVATNEKLRLSLSGVSSEGQQLISGLLIGDEKGRLGSGCASPPPSAAPSPPPTPPPCSHSPLQFR
ncbi:MAG: hypothetical protein SGPRY_010461, partial [Prymnesium sp.]